MATLLKDTDYYKRLKIISRSNSLRRRTWLAERKAETTYQLKLAKKIQELLGE